MQMKIEKHQSDMQMKAAATQQKLILEDAKAAAKVRTAAAPAVQVPPI
jgi:hypothetical protein